MGFVEEVKGKNILVKAYDEVNSTKASEYMEMAITALPSFPK
jgi:uncharacterized protein YutE (UPF0331/DUF86 family)